MYILQVRLALGLVIFRLPPLPPLLCVRVSCGLAIYLLPSSLLDEVTTHLDLSTIRGLARALRRYEGALVLITHDRWFCRVVIEGASTRESISASEDNSDSDSSEDEESQQRAPGTVYRVHNGKVIHTQGGIDEYVTKIQRAMLKKKAKQDGG